MAARKKAKSKTRRKKAPARKPATRKIAVSARKKVTAKKKPAIHRAPARKKRVAPVAVKTAPPQARKAPPMSPPPRPAAPVAETVPLAGEDRVGIVTHYFSQISVAIVRLESGSLRPGDEIHITGHTSDFRQRVESLQLEHQPVPEVTVGQEFGLKVTAHARENDIVYKVAAPQP